MLKKPATKHAFKVTIRERDVVRVPQLDIDAFLSEVFDQLAGVVDCNNIGHILLRKPASAGAEIKHGRFSMKFGLIPMCAQQKFDLADNAGASPENIVAVRASWNRWACCSHRLRSSDVEFQLTERRHLMT